MKTIKKYVDKLLMIPFMMMASIARTKEHIQLKQVLSVAMILFLAAPGVIAVSTITAPNDITKEATGVLTTVSNIELGTPVLTPPDANALANNITRDPSGNMFSVGNTAVTWTVNVIGGTTDTYSGSDVQFVTIQDTTAPVISDHSNVTVNSIVPIAVIYTSPTTTDVVDGVKTASCTPSSGSTFALGNTIVTCTATDAHGNVATPKTFNVKVMSPFGDKNAIVIITFDDGWLNTYQNAHWLTEQGLKGVIFAIPDSVDGSNYMSIANLKALYDAGWDISSHSYTHGLVTDPEFLFKADNAKLKFELGDSADWLYNQGFTHSAMFFAYPFGKYNNASFLEKMRDSKYYTAARTVDGYGQHIRYSPGEMAMLTEVIGGNIAPSVVMNEINTTINESGLIILTYHQIVTGTPANDEEYNVENFKTILKYLNTTTQSGNVRVMTLSEYFGVPSAITPLVPSTPIKSTVDDSSRKSIRFSWIDGSGPVKADNFDIIVNGVKTYFVADRFIDVPAQPGQLIDVSLVAVNRSWGRPGYSDLLVFNSTSIPSYMPSKPINMNAEIAGSSIKANWTSNDSLNKTDMFNVNVIVQSVSKWYNETTNTSVNITGLLSGQLVTVKVYALNGTIGATTKNPESAELTITMPTTDMPTILTKTADNSNFGMKWTYKAGLNTTDVEMTIVRHFENGTQSTTVETVPLLTNATGEKVLSNLPPHVAVDFSIRGYSQATYLYSDNVTANLTMENNNVVLSNIVTDQDYVTAPGSTFKLNPIATDKDNDTIVFTTGEVNGTSINSSTGEFTFNTTNLTLGRYGLNITANDSHGSITSKEFVVLVGSAPTTPTRSNSGGGGSSGGGATMGSDESISNIFKYETKDGFMRMGNDVVLKYSALNPGIYEVILNGQSQDITVRVENLKEHQKAATDITGHALLYTNVMINSVRITGFSFNFMLNKSSVTKADNVGAFVWNDGAWVKLDTKVLSSDENKVYFHVIATPAKASKFAISEGAILLSDSKTSEEPEITKLEDVNPDNSTGNDTSTAKLPGFEGVLVIAVLAILYMRRKL